jgi:hypothetical protein
MKYRPRGRPATLSSCKEVLQPVASRLSPLLSFSLSVSLANHYTGSFIDLLDRLLDVAQAEVSVTRISIDEQLQDACQCLSPFSFDRCPVLSAWQENNFTVSCKVIANPVKTDRLAASLISLSPQNGARCLRIFISMCPNKMGSEYSRIKLPPGNNLIRKPMHR